MTRDLIARRYRPASARRRPVAEILQSELA
jgi:hypothetical protein